VEEAHQPVVAAVPAPRPDDHDAMIATRSKLGELRAQGILSEEEFQAKKGQILGR
jgi:hypothetical protein